MLYYTQFVGDAVNLPVIKGDPKFYGIALLDADPYLAYGFNWYQNQNNFWRHVRNFVLDLTAMPTRGRYNGIHWQVAQGTSIQNVIFNMVDNDPKNEQQVCIVITLLKNVITNVLSSRVYSWTMGQVAGMKISYSMVEESDYLLEISSGLQETLLLIDA